MPNIVGCAFMMMLLYINCTTVLQAAACHASQSRHLATFNIMQMWFVSLWGRLPAGD